MSYTKSDIFVNSYNAILHHLSEQEGAKLKGLFAEEVKTGEKHFFDRIGSKAVSEISSLGSPIVQTDSGFTRRMCTVADFYDSELVSDIEKMQLLVDPTNPIVRAMKNAHDRNYDDVVIAALLGTAATGKTGSGSEVFDTDNVIAHGSTGLTLAKFLQGLRIFEEYDVDTDRNDIYCLLSPKGKEDLLAITNYISTDFQLAPTLAGRMLPTFRGVKFVTTNRIPNIDGSNFRAIMCTGDSLRIAKHSEPTVSIDKRVDLVNHPFQIYTGSSIGAVRMEENLVVDIRFQ